MSVVLVTGVNGFVGKHLVETLAERGAWVIGVGREPAVHPTIRQLLQSYLACDLTDREAVKKLPLKDVTAVINLAGLARVGESFEQPDLYKKVNVAVLETVGRAMLWQGSEARIIAVSTGGVYDSFQPLPLTEASKLATETSPYVTSKILMESTAGQLRRDGVEVVVVRPFNHLGPGQEGGFLLPDLYDKVANTPEKKRMIKVGNLQTKRDYTDVRDVVRAYADLAFAPHLAHPLYNVCSGRSHPGQELLDLLLAAMGLQGKVQAETDRSLIRPNDPADLFGSHQRLKDELGWQPTIPLEQTIVDFVASRQV